MRNRGRYEVGFRKPPVHTRFKKGLSGNPEGRPKHSRRLDYVLKTELDTVISLTIDGKPRNMSKREAMIRHLLAYSRRRFGRISVLLRYFYSMRLRGTRSTRSPHSSLSTRTRLSDHRHHPSTVPARMRFQATTVSRNAHSPSPQVQIVSPQPPRSAQRGPRLKDLGPWLCAACIDSTCCACFRWGRSSIFPSSPTVPPSGDAAKAASTRRAKAISC